MFCHKKESKKRSVGLVLAVGALAAVGAFAITKCGKNCIMNMKDKMCDLFKKKSCECEQQQS